jgi:hypothetical protein
MTLHQIPEQFLGAMVLDGIFEQFPNLRGGVIDKAPCGCQPC